jgi:hypothetical protein
MGARRAAAAGMQITPLGAKEGLPASLQDKYILQVMICSNRGFSQLRYICFKSTNAFLNDADMTYLPGVCTGWATSLVFGDMEKGVKRIRHRDAAECRKLSKPSETIHDIRNDR